MTQVLLYRDHLFLLGKNVQVTLLDSVFDAYRTVCKSPTCDQYNICK
jgi:hypothetical protein